MRRKFFSIPNLVASETYVWPFQYRVLNFILCTNDKLFKIGLSDSDKCSFVEPIQKICTTSSLTAPLCEPFGTYLHSGWFDLSGEYLTLSLKDIMVGLLQRNDLLNYLILLGKLTIWECRKIIPLQYLVCFCTRLKLKNKLKK